MDVAIHDDFDTRKVSRIPRYNATYTSATTARRQALMVAQRMADRKYKPPRGRVGEADKMLRKIAAADWQENTCYPLQVMQAERFAYHAQRVRAVSRLLQRYTSLGVIHPDTLRCLSTILNSSAQCLKDIAQAQATYTEYWDKMGMADHEDVADGCTFKRPIAHQEFFTLEYDMIDEWDLWGARYRRAQDALGRAKKLEEEAVHLTP